MVVNVRIYTVRLEGSDVYVIRLEMIGINSMGRDGGKYLIDAIKTKLMILNL